MDSLVLEFPEPNAVRLITEDVPTALAPDEALIQTETSIVSPGTELSWMAGQQGAQFPFRPGYGAIGTIVAKGEALTGFEVGQRVYTTGHHRSLEVRAHRDENQWAHIFPIPEGLDPVEGVVACLAQISLTAPYIAEFQVGDRVAVFGLGPIGVLAAMLFQIAGADVVGVDPLESRRERAEAAGLRRTAAGPEGEHVYRVCVEAVGRSEVALDTARWTADFGQIILLGTPRLPFPVDVTDFLQEVHLRGLVVRGALLWRFPLLPARGVHESVVGMYEKCFRWIADGVLNVRPLITHVIRPEEAPATYHALRERPRDFGLVVIDWRS